MRLFLVRHAEAGRAERDELRPLTDDGRATARALAERLRDEGVRLDAVLTSPLLRARETGAELARAAGIEAEADERLAPGASAEDVRAVVAGRGEAVAVVGHQPDCSDIAAELTGEPVRFAPGALLEIEL